MTEESARAHSDAKKLASEKGRMKAVWEGQTLKGNIRVMCRIRPPLPDTPQDKLMDFHPTKGEYVDHYQKIEVVAGYFSATGQLRATSKFLKCERTFTPEHTNKAVFEEISQLTMSALDGNKVCIFCYGQTGSGKTFTMNHRVGPPGHDDPNDGIIHRSLGLMFEHVNSSREQYQYDMKISIVEVYINDLINLFSNRKKHVINMDEATGKDMTMNLIDLAGFEKDKETGATGQRLEESKAINSSIFELNNSITALAEGKPKRAGHTLTRVLDPCLAKGCRVVMFVMVSPLKKDQSETENTMTKAEMVSEATLGPKYLDQMDSTFMLTLRNTIGRESEAEQQNFEFTYKPRRRSKPNPCSFEAA
ncbi:hypothetical protein DL766_008471 [Monosporascus sp. MC13-8B]|uniref:Kinesin motor domain-containing protein n=1 Tax=Monosporascus cannonballus TaxID=155416 RepID=A0ABY0GX06_9PEZI|nr:hypothetical protein DL762_008344 [Monosporascus cannonballus]RYO95848.1 hypothetical protein DL763_003482 [Monosporascus cannonballus]RYP19300.1 hypothetical protein DL766_008471 [Monosporascus sp. MC13-8B]